MEGQGMPTHGTNPNHTPALPHQEACPHPPQNPPVETSVHTGTLTVENPPQDTQEQAWRFRHVMQERSKLLALLQDDACPPGHFRRFRNCGRNAWIEQSPSSGRLRVVVESCKLRWCPACARQRSAKLSRWIREVATTRPTADWKLITLTYRHSGRPLAEQLGNFKADFRRLRQRSTWKNRITGGIAILEVKRSSRTDAWHPHVHVLCSGKYLPHNELKRAWMSITKGSWIVDIRPVRDPENAISYVTKYITKAMDPSLLNDATHLAEYIQATHATRTVVKFGNWPKFELEKETDDYPRDWQTVCPLVTALRHAAAGSVLHKVLLRQLENSHDERPITELRTTEDGSLPAVRDAPG